ncbi:MAG TPA: hypothetical protein DCS93_27985 [Microscillaceae bacterium]|nr:hypothetical protein [Microscillaceae bacterium]
MSNSQKANPKASNMYLLAMLADVNARMLWKTAQEAKQESEEWAYSHIQQAMNDAQGLLKNAVPSWKKYNWKVDNGWKPTVTIGETTAYFFKYYYVNNLIYLAKGVDPTNGKTIYVVSIAGTNGVSKQDWWTEDFAVKRLVNWDAKNHAFDIGFDEEDSMNNTNVKTQKKVAQGTLNGFNDLNSLKRGNQTIFRYLESQIGDNPGNFEIIVTGHSLGGTLSPVYALSLKEKAPDWNVSFFAFAGATPGNQAFADYTAQTLGENQMHSFWNKMDIVPHAWDHAHMAALENIYVPCIGSGHSLLLNKVLEYFTELAQDNYARFDAKSYSSFNNAKICITIDDKVLDSIVGGIGRAHDNLRHIRFRKAINLLCGLDPMLGAWRNAKPFVEHFCKYLLEALGQHVQPYFYNFVENDAKLFEEFIQAYFYAKNIPDVLKEFVDRGDEILLFKVLKRIINTVAFDKALQQLQEKELV